MTFHYLTRSKTSLKILFVIAMTSLLAACSNMDNTSKQQPSYVAHNAAQWQQNLQALQKIGAYHAEGRLGYISPKERFTVGFKWRFTKDHDYELFIFSSLSSRTLTITENSQGVAITDEDGVTRQASDIHTLLISMLGFDFPIEQFPYWLKGEPTGAVNYNVDQNYHLANLLYSTNNSIWKVDYKSYDSKQPALPKSIELSDGTQTLKIAINKWILK